MQQKDFEKAKSTGEATLYNIVEDLCKFILREVIPSNGKYHDRTSALAKREYGALREISRLKLTRSGYFRAEISEVKPLMHVTEKT